MTGTQCNIRCHQLVVFGARVVTYVCVLVRVYVRCWLMSEHGWCSVMKCTCVYVLVYTSVCVRAPVHTCVSACVSACVDVCTYHKTSRQLIVLMLTTSSSTSLSSSPQSLRLLRQIQLFISTQMSTLVSKQTSVISINMSPLSQWITTVVLHFDIITRVTTFRDVLCYIKCIL